MAERDTAGNPNVEPDEARIAADLVQRIARGERAAEGEMVERYSRGLLYFLRRLSGDPHLAEDLHQETFRIVLERLRERGLDEPAKLSAFLRRTARYVFLGQHRKRKRRRTEPDPEILERAVDTRPGPHRRAVTDEAARSVREVIARLGTERDRQILYRFYVAEHEKEEICSDLQLDGLHFNRVLYRAKQRFRALLEQPHLAPASGAWPRGG